MVIKLINNENIWIPTPKLFFNIINETGMQIASAKDKEDITNSLNNILNSDKIRDPWFFNIRLFFYVLSMEGKESCDVRIVKSRKDDNCTSCIIISTATDLINNRDFDYNFTSNDL